MANAALKTPVACDFHASPPIDLVYLARQTLGDRDLEIELLSMFERQAGQIVDQLENPGQSATFRRDLAHTLCGSARAIGANGVAAVARDYENSVLRGPGPEVEERRRLREMVAGARAAIKDLLGDR